MLRIKEWTKKKKDNENISAPNKKEMKTINYCTLTGIILHETCVHLHPLDLKSFSRSTTTMHDKIYVNPTITKIKLTPVN